MRETDRHTEIPPQEWQYSLRTDNCNFGRGESFREWQSYKKQRDAPVFFTSAFVGVRLSLNDFSKTFPSAG